MPRNKNKYISSLVITIIVFLCLAYAIKNYLSGSVNKINLLDETSKINKDEIEKIVEKYINNNPKVILDSLEKYAKNNMNNAVETIANEDLASLKANAPTFGSSNPTTTIITLHDLRCFYCKKLAYSLITLKNMNPNLQLVFKEMPILGELSELISKIGLAIHKIAPDSYYNFYQKTTAKDRINQPEDVWNIVAELNLDKDQIKSSIEQEEITNNINDTLNFARKYNIRGTPAIIINNQLYSRYLSMDQLKDIIKNQEQKNN